MLLVVAAASSCPNRKKTKISTTGTQHHQTTTTSKPHHHPISYHHWQPHGRSTGQPTAQQTSVVSDDGSALAPTRCNNDSILRFELTVLTTTTTTKHQYFNLGHHCKNKHICQHCRTNAGSTTNEVWGCARVATNPFKEPFCNRISWCSSLSIVGSPLRSWAFCNPHW